VTDTVTGAPVSSFTALISGSRLTVSAPGYVTRETSAAAPRLDLFPEASFSLAFYRQIARNAIEGRMDPLWVLPQAPAFFVETEGAKGFSTALVARFETIARRMVPLMTGGRFQVAGWQTGPTLPAPRSGVIVVEHRNADTECGKAWVGELAGSIWLSQNPACRSIERTFAHEIGHALGFWHVDAPGSLMMPSQGFSGPTADAPTEMEARHMALAYSRPRGNRDVDVDPEAAAGSAAGRRIP
jgi:hypothetical protein